MGIPSYRFIGKDHKEFICAVCKGVAIDPYMMNDCKHIFCSKCLLSAHLTECLTCNVPYPQWQGLSDEYKRKYLSLEIKCFYPSCDQILDVRTWLHHDETCPITFEFCPSCEYKFCRGRSGVHSCIQQVRLDEQQRRLDKLERQLKEERKRTEDLVMICISFRKNFNDYDFNEDYVKNLKRGYSRSDNAKTMKKILDEFNKP